MGSCDRTRTYNLPVNSRLLCQLSYAGPSRAAGRKPGRRLCWRISVARLGGCLWHPGGHPGRGTRAGLGGLFPAEVDCLRQRWTDNLGRPTQGSDGQPERRASGTDGRNATGNVARWKKGNQMRYKAMFIAGFAVGFIAGARSGRGTYDKLVATSARSPRIRRCRRPRTRRRRRPPNWARRPPPRRPTTPSRPPRARRTPPRRRRRRWIRSCTRPRTSCRGSSAAATARTTRPTTSPRRRPGLSGRGRRVDREQRALRARHPRRR